MVNKLIIQGILELEEHCWFFLNGSETSDFLGKFFLEHFSPEHLQSLHKREMIGIQKMLSVTELPFDSPERRKIVEEFERLMEGYSDYFRVTFEPLANQGEILILEGDLSVEGFEFSIEGPSRSGFLSTIFL